MAPLVGLALQAVPSLIKLFDKDKGESAEKAAGVVASVLGVDDPMQAQAKLAENPELMIKLKEALYEFKSSQEEEITKRLQAVNETMRAESQSRFWFSAAWRPFWGAVSAVTFAVCCVGVLLIAWQAIKSKDANAMTMIPNLVMQMTMLFGIPGAILGVASWHRGKEKRFQAGER